MILVKQISNKFYSFLLILPLFFYSCSNNHNIIISGNTMGTTYTVTINNFNGNKKEFKSKIDRKLKALNKIFSTYDPNSEITKINQSSADIIKISDAFKYVLDKALIFSDVSNGNYDITIGRLIDLWGFNNYDIQEIPKKTDILKVLSHIGYKNLSINNNLLIRKNKLVQIDLNSIAKGYAVDEIAKLINEDGYDNFLVEIGGELKSKGDDWLIGIQDPINSQIIKKINFNNMSIATSGNYNNYFEINGERYSHILNPQNGFPYNYKTVSATVLAKDCIDADAYATIAMTIRSSDFIDLINKTDNTEVYLIEIDDNGAFTQVFSEGFESYIVD